MKFGIEVCIFSGMCKNGDLFYRYEEEKRTDTVHRAGKLPTHTQLN
jgi:hypothetical protein